MKNGDIYYCSFCGKSQNELDQIIAGPAPHDICNECVDICVEIVYENNHTLPSVDELLGKKPASIHDQLGIKPRFSKTNINRVENQCFYLCPFTEPFNTIYRDHVVPTIKKAGLIVKRSTAPNPLLRIYGKVFVNPKSFSLTSLAVTQMLCMR